MAGLGGLLLSLLFLSASKLTFATDDPPALSLPICTATLLEGEGNQCVPEPGVGHLCPAGYECCLSEPAEASHFQCQDINECEMDNGGCEDECVNTPGSRECRCGEGFVINPDGTTCALMCLETMPALDGRTLRGSSGTVNSINYPENFPPRCRGSFDLVWDYAGQYNTLKITFNDFQVESNLNFGLAENIYPAAICPFDFLRIGDTDHCGFFKEFFTDDPDLADMALELPYDLDDIDVGAVSQITVQFSTGNIFEHRGFYVTWQLE